MLQKTTIILCLGLSVAGCARLTDSRLNPLNWFGRSTSQPVSATATQEIRPLITGRSVAIETRGLVHSVTALSIEHTSSGAIIRATGVADTQDQFNAELVLESVENGVLTYGFRIEKVADFAALGSAASRQITVATLLTNAELAGVRSIRVVGASNSRTSRR